MPNGMPICAYVVNLERSSDRLAHITTQLQGAQLGFKVVRAVDGRLLDVTDPAIVTPSIAAHKTFRPGAAGSALSHLEAYRRAISDGYDIVLVLEDDVVVPHDLARLVEAVLPAMDDRPEVVLLNFHVPRPARMLEEGRVPLQPGRWLAYPADPSDYSSGGGYLITRAACENIKRANTPITFFADRWGQFLELGVLQRLRCVSPMPVMNSAAFRTTIDHFPAGSMRDKAYQKVAAIESPFLQRLLSYRRAYAFRRRGWTGREVFVGRELSKGPTFREGESAPPRAST
jgi:hypothetical protein